MSHLESPRHSKESLESYESYASYASCESFGFNGFSSRTPSVGIIGADLGVSDLDGSDLDLDNKQYSRNILQDFKDLWDQRNYDDSKYRSLFSSALVDSADNLEEYLFKIHPDDSHTINHINKFFPAFHKKQITVNGVIVSHDSGVDLKQSLQKQLFPNDEDGACEHGEGEYEESKQGEYVDDNLLDGLEAFIKNVNYMGLKAFINSVATYKIRSDINEEAVTQAQWMLHGYSYKNCNLEVNNKDVAGSLDDDSLEVIYSFSDLVLNLPTDKTTLSPDPIAIPGPKVKVYCSFSNSKLDPACDRNSIDILAGDSTWSMSLDKIVLEDYPGNNYRTLTSEDQNFVDSYSEHVQRQIIKNNQDTQDTKELALSKEVFLHVYDRMRTKNSSGLDSDLRKLIDYGYENFSHFDSLQSLINDKDFRLSSTQDDNYNKQDSLCFKILQHLLSWSAINSSLFLSYALLSTYANAQVAALAGLSVATGPIGMIIAASVVVVSVLALCLLSRYKNQKNNNNQNNNNQNAANNSCCTFFGNMFSKYCCSKRASAEVADNGPVSPDQA